MKSFLTLLTLFLASALFGQTRLVAYQELTAVSETEGAILEAQGKAEKVDYLAAFLALDPTLGEAQIEQIENQIQKTCDQLLAAGLAKRKPDKKVKMIYNKIHETFLKKYEMENRFHEIFRNGNYNCVTATALYAIVLDKLDVPYEIKEEPTHVYLLAYPNIHNVLIETTTPLFGYVTFEPKFKASFVGNLKNQKIISQQESQSKSVDELFNDHYFKNEKIDLTKLVGIHYLNDALFNSDHEQRIAAFQQAEKAYLFYPSQRVQFNMMILCAEILAKEKLSPVERAFYIGRISRYEEQGISHEMIEGEFMNLTRDVLGKDNNKALFADSYASMSKEVQDPKLLEKLSFIYNYELARTYYNEGKFVPSYPYFKKALTLQPNNVDLGRTFVNCLTQTFRFEESNNAVLDTLNRLSKEFPSLTELEQYNAVVGDAYLIEMLNAFGRQQASEGEALRKRFENHMLMHKNLPINHELLGRAYSQGCTYYFRRGQKTKAREILDKGLSYAPNSYELRVRQQMMH